MREPYGFAGRHGGVVKKEQPVVQVLERDHAQFCARELFQWRHGVSEHLRYGAEAERAYRVPVLLVTHLKRQVLVKVWPYGDVVVRI